MNIIKSQSFHRITTEIEQQKGAVLIAKGKTYFKVQTITSPKANTSRVQAIIHRDCQGTTDNRFTNKPTAQNATGRD